MRICAQTLQSELNPAELEFLTRLLKQEDLKGKHLEIGTAAGGTLCQMICAYPENAHPLFSVVDTMTYFSHQKEVVNANLRKHGIEPESIDFRVQTSQKAYEQASKKGERFSLIFLDAGHKFRNVMEDLRFGGLLELNGLLCVHDYNSRFPGVTQATNRFLKRNPHYEIVGVEQSLLVLKKRRESKQIEVSRFDLYYATVVSFIQQLQNSLLKRVEKI